MKTNSDRTKSRSWEDKYKELRKEHRKLRAQLAKVEEQRDSYIQSLHLFARKQLSISKKEMRAMMENPLGIDDVLQELEKEARKHA
jgi:hypothetical protein